MVLHTFSRINEWLEDYMKFLSLYGLEGGVNNAVSVQIEPNINLHFAWVHGDEKYLEAWSNKSLSAMLRKSNRYLVA